MEAAATGNRFHFQNPVQNVFLLSYLSPVYFENLPTSFHFPPLPFQAKYIPRDCAPHGAAPHLLRLLLLYHDPELCSFLDSKKVSPDLYAGQWFKTLFASCCNIQVVFAMWDVYFQANDPFLGMCLLTMGNRIWR